MIKLEYRSNNSGGSWWLSDKDWLTLEAAGWTVDYYKDQENRFSKGDRFLGALANGASKEFETPDDGIAEFVKITDQDPWAEGCNCCGRPHMFSYEDAKGETHYPEVEVNTSFSGWT
jgi:hypothetical protein